MKHQFSTFAGNIKDSKVRGSTDLPGLIQDIQNPDEFTRCIIDELRAETDEQKRADLKARLKGYTPAVLVEDRRRLVNIISYSGLMPLDFDKLPDKDFAIRLRDFLFTEYSFIYATWLSSSGKGVRAIVHIDHPKSKEDFQAMFNGLKHYKLSDFEFIEYFDDAPKNVVLPLFQSYDPDIRYRQNASIWSRRYYEPDPVLVNLPPLESPDDDNKRHVYNIVRSAINKISDNGHPQLRATAFALGGYVGANYISFYDAIQLINDLIDRNDYLSKKPQVYKITAKQMITQGTSKPLYL
jgi:hypothetical protein